MRRSDEEILSVLTADKSKGVQLLFERYYRPLVVFATELVRDQMTAEDLVQDLFLALWEGDSLTALKAPALASYLFVSIRNRCYTHLNRKDALRDPVDLADVDVAADTAASISQEIVDRVTEEIKKMSEQTAKVLSCILLDDMKYQECADHLHVSVNTVKTLLRNGMKALGEAMKDDRDLILLHIFYHPHFQV